MGRDKRLRDEPAATGRHAALANRIPLASKASNSAAVCASVSRKCGGRMFSQRESPVFRATSAFSPGSAGPRSPLARRRQHSCAAAPVALFQFA